MSSRRANVNNQMNEENESILSSLNGFFLIYFIIHHLFSSAQFANMKTKRKKPFFHSKVDFKSNRLTAENLIKRRNQRVRAIIANLIRFFLF